MARPRRRGGPCEAPRAPRLQGRARSSVGSTAAPSRRWAGPPLPPRRCCAAAGKPASAAPASHPRPGPRRAASSGATWRPGPRLPHRPGLTAPQLSGRPSSCLADSRPARSRPAGPRSLWEPAGRGRSAPASLPDPAAVLAAAKGPGGLPRSPGEAVLDVGPGPCTSLCRGEEACKMANSSRSWKTQLWQSLPGRRLR